MLAECITGVFVHGFLPDSMLSTVLVPIIKDKTGRIDRMDNYRPIALASVMSNVKSLFESVWVSTETGYRHLHLHSERDCGKVSEFKWMYIYVFPRCFQSV